MHEEACYNTGLSLSAFLHLSTRGTVPLRKGNNRIFEGLADTGSKLTIILRVLSHRKEPKTHYGFLVNVGAYACQAINRLLFFNFVLCFVFCLHVHPCTVFMPSGGRGGQIP